MTRAHNPDDICAMCDEYSVPDAVPEYAAIGMGRCGIAEPSKPHRHVAWNCETCVSYRLDRPNLAARRQYVAIQQRTQEPKP